MRVVKAQRLCENFFKTLSQLVNTLGAGKTDVRRQQTSIDLEFYQQFSMAKKGGYYAVQNGRKRGVFTSWDECKGQVSGFPGARYKRFDSLSEARAFSNVANTQLSADSTVRSVSVPNNKSEGMVYEHSSKPISLARKTPNRVGKPKYYSVKSSNANVPSKIFGDWTECQRYVKGKKGLSFKKFDDESSAKQFMEGNADASIDFKHIGISKEEFESKYSLPNSISKYTETSNVYCDGSALSNGTSSSTAGYGVYFEESSEDDISERLTSGLQTNNRAEIQAVASALDRIWKNLTTKDKKLSYQIKTDSEYVAKLLNDRYFSYTDQEFRAMSNGDLILPLVHTFTKVKQYYKINADKFANGGQFTIKWVKGHAGEPGNEYADELARRGAMKT